MMYMAIMSLWLGRGCFTPTRRLLICSTVQHHNLWSGSAIILYQAIYNDYLASLSF